MNPQIRDNKASFSGHNLMSEIMYSVEHKQVQEFEQ